MSNQTFFPSPVLSTDFTLFEATPGMRFVFIPNGLQFTIAAVTKDMCQHTGRSKEQLVGSSIFKAFPSNPDDPTDTGEHDLMASLKHVLQYKEPHQLPTQRYDIKDEDGNFSKHYWKVSNVPVMNADDDVTFIIQTTADITAQVEAEKMKEKMKGMEQVHRLFLQSPVPIQIYKGPDLTLQLANEPALAILGKDSDIIGKPLLEILPEIREQGFAELLSGVMERCEPLHLYDIPISFVVNGKGKQGYYNTVFQPYYEENNTKTSGVIVFGFDVTQKVLAQKRVEESEQNFRNTILQSPVAMCIFRGPTHVVEIANDRMYELWGRGKEVLLGKSIFEGLPEAKDQGYEALLNGVFNTGERFTAQGIPVKLPRNGRTETVYINLLYEAYKDVEGIITGVTAVANDVTEQVVASMKVEESQREFQFVTDFMPQMIWVTGADGYHYYYNKQWYDYTGLTNEGTEGKGWNEVFHPDDRQRALEVWQHSLHTGEPYEIEYRCRRHDGEYCWFLGRALPLKDADGRIVKWFGTCTDIDDQRRASDILESRIKERTRELELRNQEMEQFTYVSHHDLQEPLRKITMFSDLVRSEAAGKLSENAQQRLKKISDAAHRMSTALRDVLNFAALNQEEQFSYVDLNEVLAVVQIDLELIIQEKGASVTISPLPVIKAIHLQMHQLLYNLMNNALKFTRAGVKPIISITCRKWAENDLEACKDLDQNRSYHQISVQDNGIGFSEQYKEKIFALFQRLHSKSDYAGTGIGLALVKKVVVNHHGKVWAESKEGKGSTFHILLPAL